MKKTYIAVALIITATTLAYLPVMFNFFSGDDFVHLSWLSKAINNPDLLLRNFNHPWLEIATIKFYRPLISVFMYTDYLMWRTNGFGFHLTNLLFHIANSLLVFAVYTQIEKTLKKTTSYAPLVAGLLFGLYPLHCEAVSWITGRVDDIVATFYLASMWLFMRWRSGRVAKSRGKSAIYLALSLVSMTLSLMSKEMAVTIPALLSALDFLLPEAALEANLTLVSKFKSTILMTLPFWILLVIYFIVRRLALGTFVGGYDDSLFFIANIREFVQGWKNGLTMIAQPANQLVIGSHNVALIAWDLGLAGALIGLLAVLKKDESKKLLPFLLVWIALSLAPVYKIFSISLDLQSSRLAYLVTAPLSMLIAYGLIAGAETIRSSKIVAAKFAFHAACASLLVSAFAILWKNNEVWRQSGLEMNAIRSTLADVYKNIDDDPQTLLLGIPDQIKGAYTGRNAVPDMLQKPQFIKDLKNCTAFDTAMPILPFGFLKQSLSENANKAQILFWDQEKKNWLKVSATALSAAAAPATTPPNWNSADIAAHTHKGTGKKESVSVSFDNVEYGKREFIFVELAQTPDSEFRGDVKDKKEGKTNSPMTLTFTNDLSLTTKQPIKISGFPYDSGSMHGCIFSLRANPYWAFAHSAKNLTFDMHQPLILKSIRSINSQTLMPNVNFVNSGFLGSKGFTHLSKADPSTTISCVQNDASGAKSFALEILRLNIFLSSNDENSPLESKSQWKLIKGDGKTGKITLERKDFPSDGIYQARLFALDAEGNTTGVAGDHINISVEPN